HGDLEHRRMRLDRVLDLDGGDVLATGDDDVLLAITQLDIPIRVLDAEIPCVQPSALEGVLGGHLVAVVPGHHVVATHHDLAHRLTVARNIVHPLVDHPHRIGLDHRDALPRLPARL